MRFSSPRQALAYLYAHHRGPTLARPKYHDAPGDTGRSHWDGPIVGALLYGPRETGGCGVVPGGPVDLELRAWVSSASADRVGSVWLIERRLRACLRAAGILIERPRVPRVRRWTDADGVVWGRLDHPRHERENSPCAPTREVVKIP